MTTKQRGAAPPRTTMTHAREAARGAMRVPYARVECDGNELAYVREVLESGAMKAQAAERSRAQRRTLAEYLAGKPFGSAPPDLIARSAFCSDAVGPFRNNLEAPAWNGWGVSMTNTRFQPAASAQLTAQDVPRLKLKWAYAFQGDVNTIGAPAVIGRYLFVGSASGAVQALDARSGCVHWTFQADGPVRSAIFAVPVEKNSTRHALMFGDLTGWYYSLDAATGRLLWKKRIDAHDSVRLTGAAAVYQDMIFVPAASWEETRATNADYACCTFRGSVTALRIKDGSQVWKTYTIEDEPKPLGNTPGAVGQW